MSTLFVALQCFQCSTMQVKQQRKKSISKWVCAVCNQRQPVRRIHARGPLASDLRRFVQSFNMSRGSVDPDPIPIRSNGSRESDAALEHDPLVGDGDRFQKRMDWSEYLDPKEEDGRDGDRSGNGDEVLVVTELPREMFKISSQKRPGRVSKPDLSKRKRNEERISSQGGMVSTKTVAANGRSRWREYLEEGDEDERSSGQGGFRSDGHDQWSDTGKQPSDLPVDEEVHPDFRLAELGSTSLPFRTIGDLSKLSLPKTVLTYYDRDRSSPK